MPDPYCILIAEPIAWCQAAQWADLCQLIIFMNILTRARHGHDPADPVTPGAKVARTRRFVENG